MKCRNCGLELKAGSEFCKNCGSKIKIEKQYISAEMKTESEVQHEHIIKKEVEGDEQAEIQQLEQQLSVLKKDYEKTIKEKKIEQKQLAEQIRNCKIEKQILQTENYMIESGKKVSSQESPNARIHIGKIVQAKEEDSEKTFMQQVQTGNVSSSTWIAIGASIIITLMVLFGSWIKILGHNITIYKMLSTSNQVTELGSGFSNENIDGTLRTIRVFCFLGFLMPVLYWIRVYFLVTKDIEFVWKKLSIYYNIIFCCIFFFCVFQLHLVAKEAMSDYGEIESLFGNATSTTFGNGIAPFVVLLIGIAEWFMGRSGDVAEVQTEDFQSLSDRAEKIPVMNYNPSLCFRVTSAVIGESENTSQFYLEITGYLGIRLEALLAVVDFIDNLGEIYRLENCRMDIKGNDWTFCTDKMGFEFVPLLLKDVVCAKVYVQKYVIDSAIHECKEPHYELEMSPKELLQYRREQDDEAAVVKYLSVHDGWMCTCGVLNMEQNTECWNCKKQWMKNRG